VSESVKRPDKIPVWLPPDERVSLTPQQRARLRADSLCDERTIKRWWSGLPVRASSAERLQSSSTKLGLRRPE